MRTTTSFVLIETIILFSAAPGMGGTPHFDDPCWIQWIQPCQVNCGKAYLGTEEMMRLCGQQPQQPQCVNTKNLITACEERLGCADSNYKDNTKYKECRNKT